MTDNRLPQLGTLLDADAMRGVLSAECLAGHRWQAVDCRIGHVRYKPGRSCLVHYELDLRENGRRFRQGFCVRAYAPGESESRWRKALTQELVEVATGPALVHVERLGLIVWAFPNERKLRGIEVLLDAERLIRDVLPAALGQTVVAAEPELVRYVPEHGCTVRVVVRLAAGSLMLYGKLYAGGEGAVTYERMRELGRRVWYQPSLRILWQEELPGDSASLDSAMEPCARALAALHTRGWNHGDLHLKNFLVHEDRAELIDLDTLHAGDPLDDLGSFAASLYHRAALGQCSQETADEKIRAFVAEYARHVPWPVVDRDVAIRTAKSLVDERVHRSISRQKGDVVEVLQKTAQRLLDRTASARDIMRRHQNWVAARPGQVLDVYYKTYRKQQSWHKSFATVSWRDSRGAIHVESNGPEPFEWEFPDDSILTWIRDVPQYLPIAGEQAKATVLNYRPGNRVTARFDVDGRTVYAKTYSDDRGLRVHERLTALRTLGFPMPSPLGYSPEVRTVWQEAFAGQPLRDLLGGLDDSSLLAGAAQRLRFLHESGVACSPRHSLEDQHADLEKKMAKLAAALPGTAARLAGLVDRLRSALPALSPVAPAVVHGDFHVRQLMVGADGAVALFDFDEIGCGDPVEDFGHFIADLHGDGFTSSEAVLIGERLIRGYGRPIAYDRLCWHTALQLLTRAYRALLQLKPDFDERAEHHVQLAEELI